MQYFKFLPSFLYYYVVVAYFISFFLYIPSCFSFLFALLIILFVFCSSPSHDVFEHCTFYIVLLSICFLFWLVSQLITSFSKKNCCREVCRDPDNSNWLASALLARALLLIRRTCVQIPGRTKLETFHCQYTAL